jgi:hypothetical protein
VRGVDQEHGREAFDEAYRPFHQQHVRGLAQPAPAEEGPLGAGEIARFDTGAVGFHQRLSVQPAHLRKSVLRDDEAPVPLHLRHAEKSVAVGEIHRVRVDAAQLCHGPHVLIGERGGFRPRLSQPGTVFCGGVYGKMWYLLRCRGLRQQIPAGLPAALAALRSLWRSSFSFHGGRQASFQRERRGRASSSERSKPRTSATAALKAAA